MKYTKTIGLDLRFLQKNNYYSQFIYELIGTFIKNSPEYFFNIYLDLSFANLNFPENTKNIFPKSKYKSIREQTHLGKKIKENNNDIVIFFSHNKPITFKNKYIVFIPELSNFHFPKKQNFLIKYFENILLKNSCKNAEKIVCFDKKTKEEINDKFNIYENKINILTPFFSKQELIINEEVKNLTLNLETKYNIKGEYFIYNSGIGIEKNIDKLVEVFSILKENKKDLNLIILDEESIKDLYLRKKVIENNLTDKIFFIGNIGEYEKDYFYKNSIGIILPDLYNIFPFSLNKALNYGINILASNINTFKNIFGNKIDFFNPNNTQDIYNKIVNTKKQNNNYSTIFEKYNIEKTLEDLKNIIK